MNVQELEGAELDAAVAKAEGYIIEGEWVRCPNKTMVRSRRWTPRRYSTEWESAGPIIERERITLMHVGGPDGFWNAGYEPEVDEGSQCESGWIDLPAVTMTHECSGPTPLIAAMRAYVASKEPA